MKWSLRVMFAAGAAVFVLWAGWKIRETWRGDEAFKHALALVDRGAFEAAWPILQAQYAQSRVRPEYWLARGVCASGLGRTDEAFKSWGHLTRGSSLWRRAVPSRLALARGSGRYGNAIDIGFKDLPDTGPRVKQAREDLLFLLRIEGRLDDARDALRAWLHEEVDPIPSLRELWSLDHEAYPVHAARTVLDEAAARAPGDEGVRLGMANLAWRTGEFDAALKHLECVPSSASSQRCLTEARLKVSIARGDIRSAVEAIEQLTPEVLGITQWCELRAWSARQIGDRASEANALLSLLKIEPMQPRALDRLAELRALDGLVDVAAAYRQRKAQRDTAERAYEDLVTSQEASARALELARLSEQLGALDEARVCWRLVARTDVRNITARESLARLEQSRLSTSDTREQIREEILAMSRTQASLAGGSGENDEVVIPWFVESAHRIGIETTFDNGDTPEHQMPETMSGGAGLLDFDGDSKIDVYVAQGGRFPPLGDQQNADKLFRNRGDGTFEDVSERCGISGFTGGYTHGVTVGDVNNDGYPDLFITRWRHYALYLNKGDGRFDDATDAWGLGGERGWPTSAAFADLDGDGDLDLYVCHYVRWDAEHPTLCKTAQGKPAFCAPGGFPSESDHLFRNDSGIFSDISDEAGITAADRDGRGLGVVVADMNGDRQLDLFVANDTTANYLFLNRGGLRFEENALSAGLAANAEGGFLAGMGVACGDLDGDGLIDLAVTNYYGECTTFYRNLGNGLFADSTHAAGISAPTRYRLGFGIVFADMNNDGINDLVQANGHVEDLSRTFPYAMPAQLLLGTPTGRMKDVTERAGAPWQVPRFGRGLAVGDLDDDGMLDALLVDLRGPLAVIGNLGAAQGVGSNSPTKAGYLILKLRGTASNRDAVGAEVIVEANGRRWVQHRFGGGSYLSACDTRLHFGLGAATVIDSITIRWPSGSTVRHEGITPNASYLVIEGSPNLERSDARDKPNLAEPKP